MLEEYKLWYDNQKELCGIRHTNATLLISQNVDVAVVAARLGRAQISTTFNFYVRPLASHNRSAGIILQNLLIDKN